MHYFTCSIEEAVRIAKEIAMNIPEFVDLNLSKNEIKKGIKVDDPNRGPFLITNSVYSSEDDFIDLDSVFLNLTVTLRNSAIARLVLDMSLISPKENEEKN